jgi:hypothetical protein
MAAFMADWTGVFKAAVGLAMIAQLGTPVTWYSPAPGADACGSTCPQATSKRIDDSDVMIVNRRFGMDANLE